MPSPSSVTGRLLRTRVAPGALALVLLGAVTRMALGGEAARDPGSPTPPPPYRAELVNLPTVAAGRALDLDFDSLQGRSGQLRVRLLEDVETGSYPTVAARFDGGLTRAGFHSVESAADGSPFHFVTLTPWTRKFGGYIGNYHVGFWPAELRRMPENYENPRGFIEVDRAGAGTRVSTHFTLGDFLSRDQPHAWPKYLVLREDLLDKLELVLSALESFGVPTRHVSVLSGFRSPQYNARGVGEGMAQASRHQFGDASDIIIDADRDGRMDDLNRDGRITFDDLQVLDRAVQLIERRFPELVGGLGLYHAMGPSGPFAHIDVRGKRARWTNGTRIVRRAGTTDLPDVAVASGRCMAEGPMAVLCAGMR